MNNFYGYLSHNGSNFSNLHSEEPSGLWTSKKTRQKLEKEHKLVLNRVNLLELEDKKLKKKIMENREKMLQIFEKKRNDYKEMAFVFKNIYF